MVIQVLILIEHFPRKTLIFLAILSVIHFAFFITECSVINSIFLVLQCWSLNGSFALSLHLSTKIYYIMGFLSILMKPSGQFYFYTFHAHLELFPKLANCQKSISFCASFWLCSLFWIFEKSLFFMFHSKYKHSFIFAPILKNGLSIELIYIIFLSFWNSIFYQTSSCIFPSLLLRLYCRTFNNLGLLPKEPFGDWNNVWEYFW